MIIATDSHCTLAMAARAPTDRRPTNQVSVNPSTTCTELATTSGAASLSNCRLMVVGSIDVCTSRTELNGNVDAQQAFDKLIDEYEEWSKKNDPF
jgi:hypothetical protein